MRRSRLFVRRSAVFVVAYLALFPAVVRAGTDEPRFIRHSGAVPSEYIVALPDDTPSESVDSIAAALAREYRLTIIRTYHAAFPGFHCRASERTAQGLAKDGRVAFVEENLTGRVSSVESPDAGTCDVANNRWTLHRITHRPAATKAYSYPHASGGKDVVAYVVDTGVLRTHTQFEGRVQEGYNAIKSDPASWSYDPCNPNDPTKAIPSNAHHGTSVASILGGKDMGVAPEVTIVPVRVIPCSEEWKLADILDGLDWVVKQPLNPKGAVLNMSFEGPITRFSAVQQDSLDVALTSVANRGIVTFVAAGNFSSEGKVDGDACTGILARRGYGSGHGSPRVVVSSGTNISDQREKCSQKSELCGNGWEFGYGQCVDLFAPATNVRAAYIGMDDEKNTEERSTDCNGTSWASPMTAGAAARLLVEEELYKGNVADVPYKVWQRLRDTATRRMIKNTTDHPIGVGSPNRILYIDAIKIDKQPESVFVKQNSGTALLEIFPKDTDAAYSYQWYSGAYTPEVPILNATSATFYAPTDVGELYWVKVTGGGGATTDSMLAKVTLCASLRRPTIPEPSSPTNSSRKLTVDDDTGTGYDWYIGTPGETDKFVVHTPGPSYVFNPFTTDDYWVRVTHGSCEVDSANSVTVTGCQPVMTSEPQRVFVTHDTVARPTTKLTVVAEGNDLTYQWFEWPTPSTKQPVPNWATGYEPEKTGKAPEYIVQYSDKVRTCSVLISSSCGASVESQKFTVTFAANMFDVKARNANQPPSSVTPMGAVSNPAPVVYVPKGGSIALTVRPMALDASSSAFNTPTEADVEWTDPGTTNPTPTTKAYYVRDVQENRLLTAKVTQFDTIINLKKEFTRAARVLPCNDPPLVKSAALALTGGHPQLTFNRDLSDVDVEWYKSDHDDRDEFRMAAATQHFANVANGAVVTLDGTLNQALYWARVIAASSCGAGKITEDTETTPAPCIGRCPGHGRTGFVKANGVATAYYEMNGQQVTLTPPTEAAGDTYEWRHDTNWDLTETPFSTASKIENAQVGTYWVSTKHADGTIDDSYVTTLAPPLAPGFIPVSVFPSSRFVGGQATVIIIPTMPSSACAIDYKWWQGNDYTDPLKFPPYDTDNEPSKLNLFDIPDTSTFWLEASWLDKDTSGNCPTQGTRRTGKSDLVTITVTCDPPASVSAWVSPDSHVAKNELVQFAAQGWGKLLTYNWYDGEIGDRSSYPYSGHTVYKTYMTDSSAWVEVVDSCDNKASAQVRVYVCKPTITTQPAGTMIIRADQTKQLYIAALPAQTGQTLSYQWYYLSPGRLKEAIPGATSPTLNVTGPATSYWCHVTSTCSDGAQAVAISREAQVNVCAPPAITSLTPSYFVTTNKYETLHVEATGAELTYQWYRGPKGVTADPLAAAIDASYTLLPQTTTTYWVRVTSQGECSIDSNAITLTVCTPPQLNSGPAANPPIVFSGGISTLTVSATPTSAAPLHYTWFEVADLGNVVVCSDQPTCTTDPLTAAKTYLVLISSGGLVAIESPLVTVSVCTFPQTIPGAPDAQVSANTPYFLTLPIDPPDGNTITWYRGASGNTGTPVQSGPGPQLIINETVSGQYWAKVERGGCTSSSTTTNVLVCVPKAAAQPSPGSIIAGESHTMTFGAGGTDAPLTYQWYRGDPGNDRDPVVGQTSPSATVSPAAATTYFCRVTSNCGRILDSNATVVNVCERPVVNAVNGSSIAPGQNGVVSVTATGSNLTYQWYRGASGNTTQLIAGAVNPTFAESPAATSVYWCRVTNGTCWTDSPNATITVCAPPTITTQPADVTIAAGQTTQLSVTASGATGHQWLLGDGTPISGATSATYTTPVLNEDATYRVRVYNGLCTTDSREVKVTACNLSVGVTPVVKIMRSQTATLSTSVMNARGQDLSYTWYIGASGNTSQAWAAGPPSIAVSPQDTTQYWVRVTDGTCTADSNTATVEICVPTITQQPAGVTRMLGQPSSPLSVTATLATAYQWYIGEKGDITSPVPGGTAATINVSPTADTRYWVRVIGSCGLDERGAPIGTVDSESALVTVCAPTVITSFTASASIVYGQTATLSVNATGTSLTYQWYAGASGDTTSPLDERVVVGVHTPSINVSPQNTAQYWVKVTGTCNTVNSATATVSVCATPSITAQPQSVTIFSGTSTTLSVTASEATTTPMTYQWYRGLSGDSSVPVGTNPTFTTPNLTTDTNYWVEVRCGICPSAASSTATVSMCVYPQTVSGAANVQTTVGQSVRLTAPQSNGSNQYLWYRGASGDLTNPLTGWQAASYIDVAPTVTTSYWYRLQNGSCTSNSTTTIVSVCVPTITTQPANVLINAGASTTLSVVANTTGLTYQWYIGASGTTTSPIAGATGASVTVSPAATTNYWVRVTSSCGRTADSNTAVVTICQVPAISSINPVTQWIARGQTTTINVSATGTNLTYQWYAGNSGNTTSPVIGGNGASISVAPQNTSAYWVKVTGTCGTVNSATATVQVCAAPSITTHPQSVSIFSGTSTTLSVTAFQATTSPMSYQWYRGLSGDSSVPVGTSSSTFTTPNLTADTSYWVRVSCGICNPASSNTATVSMCVYPQSVAGAANVQTTVGQLVRLTAPQSNGGNQYLWYRGASGDMSTPLTGWQVANYLDVAPTVTTSYWYRLQNGTCISNSTTTTVSVCVPTITTNPASVTIAGGTSTTLTVAASTAGVTYQWYIGASGTTTSAVAGGTAASLTVSPATTTTYWARATSTCGRTADSAAATVTVCQLPVITRQPLNAVPVNAGQTSYTDVIATGTNLTYQWYEGESGDMSTPIICGPRDACVSTTSSLSILVYSSKRVWVRIAGMCGAVNSNATWLSVYPAILSQPTGSSASYGSAASVEVGASGTALHYTWKWSNGTPVAGAADSSRLILSSITTNVSVFCEVTSGVATRTSSAADITLCDGPYITSTQVTAAGGNCRSIVVNVNPYGVDNYLWYLGPRGDTSQPQTQFNGSNMAYVCPASPTTYWCRVVGYDTNQGAVCYTDSQAVTVP